MILNCEEPYFFFLAAFFFAGFFLAAFLAIGVCSVLFWVDFTHHGLAPCASYVPVNHHSVRGAQHK